MIAHANKQISEIVYARKASDGGGAVRLTNIIRGAQVVFGGLKPSFAWLEKATKAAILAAFGQDDGWQVIGATNAYLSATAATEQTKASALAGFINQHPLYAACVGGLYPAVEYIESDHVHNGISYLIIDYYLNNRSAIDAIFSGKTMNNNHDMLMGANNATGNCESYSINGTRWMFREGGSEKNWNAASVTGNKKVQMTQDPSNPSSVTFKYLDAGTESTQTMTRGNIAATTKLYLFTIARTYSKQLNDGMRIHQFNIYEDSGMVVGLAPSYKSEDGTIGVYDFINNKFYANAGAGYFTKGSDLYQTP